MLEQNDNARCLVIYIAKSSNTPRVSD